MPDYAAPYRCPECETGYWLTPPGGKCKGYWRTNAEGAREYVAHTVPIAVIDQPTTTGTITDRWGVVRPPLKQTLRERKTRRDRTNET